MYIQSNARYLQIINYGLSNILAPHLQDAQAKSVVEILEVALKELYKRETLSGELLVSSNRIGIALAREMQSLLDKVATGKRDESEPGITELADIERLCSDQAALGYGNLRDLNNRTNTLLNRLMSLLSSHRSTIDNALHENELNRLMRAGADWDSGFPAAQRQPMEYEPYDLEQAPKGEELNLTNLQAFVDGQYPDEKIKVSNLKKIPGGMGKHTYSYVMAWEDGSTDDVILRKEDTQPVFSRGACNIAAEYDLLTAVSRNSLNVPTPLLLAHNEEAFDSDFFVMTKSPGVVPGNFFGPTMELTEELLLDVAANMARLHSVNIDAFAGYFNKHVSPSIVSGDVRNAYQIEIQYWKEEYAKDKCIPESPTNTYTWDWLLNNIPDNRERPVLVHGDFNLHNFLVENNKVTAILDWELAIAGDPAQDIAYIKPNIEKYIDWDRFMQAYYENGGREIDESTFDYYIAFANARPLIASLHNMYLFDSAKSNDVRFPYMDTDYVPQFMKNILDHSG